MTTSATFSSNPLGYTGLDYNTQPPFIKADRAPTANDKFPNGTMWEDNSIQPISPVYLATDYGEWVLLTSSSSALTQLTGDTGGAVSPTAGNINLVGGSNIQIVGNPGAHNLTISATNIAQVYWTNYSTNILVPSNTGARYVGSCQLGSVATPVDGDMIWLLVDYAGNPNFAANISSVAQKIRIGSSLSSVGGIASPTTGQGSALTLVYNIANFTWTAVSVVGTWNLT